MSELALDSACNVNVAVKPLVARLRERAADYRVAVRRLDSGVELIDAGIAVPGGLEAGRLVSEICMGGLGQVSLSGAAPFELDAPGTPSSTIRA